MAVWYMKECLRVGVKPAWGDQMWGKKDSTERGDKVEESEQTRGPEGDGPMIRKEDE